MADLERPLTYEQSRVLTLYHDTIDLDAKDQTPQFLDRLENWSNAVVDALEKSKGSSLWKTEVAEGEQLPQAWGCQYIEVGQHLIYFLAVPATRSEPSHTLNIIIHDCIEPNRMTTNSLVGHITINTMDDGKGGYHNTRTAILQYYDEDPVNSLIAIATDAVLDIVEDPEISVAA